MKTHFLNYLKIWGLLFLIILLSSCEKEKILNFNEQNIDNVSQAEAKLVL